MKRKICVLTIVILICALFSACGALMERADTGKPAAEETAEVCSKEITQPEKLAEAKKYDIAGISFDAVKEVEAEAIAEVLDRGTVLVIYDVNDEKLEQIADKLRLEYTETEKTQMQTTIGACLRKRENGSYLLSEVVAEIAKPRVEKKVLMPDEEEVKKSLDWLAKNAKIDLAEQYHEIKKEDMRFAALADSVYADSNEPENRQIGKFFADQSVFYYLYTTSNPENGHTIYLSNQDSSKYQLATIHICMVGWNVKTDGNRTIDSFAADFTVAAKNDVKVKEFHGKLRTPAESRYNVLWASHLDSARSVTVTMAGAGGGSAYSYAYRTGGIDIVNHVASSPYSNWWEAKPTPLVKNASYTISPSMIVAVSNGKTTEAQAKANFSYLYLRRSLTAGWVADQDKVVTIKFKNHKSEVIN